MPQRNSESKGSQRFRDSSLLGSEASSSTKTSGQSRKRKLNSDGEGWVRCSEKEKALASAFLLRCNALLTRPNCKARDDQRCILTKMALPEVAHIFPYSMLDQAGQKPGNASLNVGSDFWKLLNLFWDSDRIQRWKIKIFPNLEHPHTGVQACFNLICLSPNAHTMWSRGIFALKPLEISDDQTSLAVQFFWQPRPQS